MKALVTAASRHGSTMLIADAIREELAATGVSAHLFEPDVIRDISGYDAVILGSAVYNGRWLRAARKFALRFESELARRPLWLFSSGPVGDPVKPTQPPAEALALAHRLNARDHQVFEGRVERDVLSFAERFRIANLPSGDFRPWVAITVWARRIAATLKADLEPEQAAQPVAAVGAR
jgi:menaquinone-dependent protoporphyrinogen oxidase